MNDDSLILGEGVQRQQEELSPFRLTTITSMNECSESSKFSLISSKSSLKESSVGSSESNAENELASLQVAGNYNSLNSNFNTLKSKIKAAFVTSNASADKDKYRKSSMTKQLKNKFKTSKAEDLKLRSHSHGALPSLDEFSQVKSTSSEEDDINGIWSASQLQASKQAKENQNSSIAKIKKSADNANTAKVRFSRVSGSQIEILYEYHSVGCHTQKLYYLVCK